MEKKVFVMAREQDKKHSIRYVEVMETGEVREAGLVLGTAYIRRGALGDTPPDLLQITIETFKP